MYAVKWLGKRTAFGQIIMVRFVQIAKLQNELNGGTKMGFWVDIFGDCNWARELDEFDEKRFEKKDEKEEFLEYI